MNDKANQTGIENLLFRMEKFDEKVDELKWLISGTKGNYLDLIRTKTGRISAKRLDALIDGLTECLGELRAYNAKMHPGPVIIGNSEVKKQKTADGLTPKEKLFFRSYWYLLLGLSTYDNTGFVTRLCHPGTWDAVIERAEEKIPYRTSAELTRDLLVYHTCMANGIIPDEMRIPEGLFLDVADACGVLGVREQLIRQLPAADKKAAKVLMTDDERNLVDHPKAAKEAFEEEQRAIEKAFEEILPEINAYYDEHHDEINEADQILPENDERTAWHSYTSAEDWKNIFTDGERFFECCKNFCRLFAEVGAKCDLHKEIPLAIRYYLSKNGLSDWMNDDRFFTVYTYLKKAERISRAEISED